MTTAGSLVLRQDHGPVAQLTLNRPDKLNAWGSDLTDELVARFDELRSDDNVRACVITGHGTRAFSSGADISNVATHRVTASEAIAGLWEGSSPVFPHILAFPKPLVAAVNGYAIGAGFLMTLCTDIILASTNAQFALPQVSLGILPAYGGVARLSQWIGRGRALEIAYSGRRVDADEALSIGLVTSVHTQETLLGAALEFGQRLATLPAASFKLTKEAVNEGLEGSSLRSAAIGDLYRTICLQQTSDAADAHNAWRETHLKSS